MATIDDINEATRKYIESLTAKSKGIAGKPVTLTDPTDAQLLEYDAPTDSFVNIDAPKATVDTQFLCGVGGVDIGQVVWSAGNYVQPGNNTDTGQLGKIIGIATSKATAKDSPVSVRLNGVVTTTNNALVKGTVYYVSIGGSVTAVSPTVGYSQKLGVAVSSTEIALNIEQPILLA